MVQEWLNDGTYSKLVNTKMKRRIMKIIFRFKNMLKKFVLRLLQIVDVIESNHKV